jgi:hypothetical protein
MHKVLCKRSQPVWRYTAHAPSEHWDEFSYASELVTHDGAISAPDIADATGANEDPAGLLDEWDVFGIEEAKRFLAAKVRGEAIRGGIGRCDRRGDQSGLTRPIGPAARGIGSRPRIRTARRPNARGRAGGDDGRTRLRVARFRPPAGTSATEAGPAAGVAKVDGACGMTRVFRAAARTR